MTIAAGTRLGRYEIRSLIGAGGMGEVYQAQDTTLGRPVALKVLPADLTRNEERVHRFEQEAFAASSLNHPHILTIYEVGRAGQTHFIATEFVEGVALRRHAAGKSLPLTEILDICVQVASALVASHDAGIVHRDIKPENIMLRPDGYVKVVDFGLAKLYQPQAPPGDRESTVRRLVETEPGVVMGTINYMSPEQARGLQVDERSDLWSLGVVIYELAAGRPPFTGETPGDVLAAVLTATPPRLDDRLPEAPDGLLHVLRRALAKEPSERYQTAGEMLADLRRLKRRADAAAEELDGTREPDARSVRVRARVSGEGAAFGDDPATREPDVAPSDQSLVRSAEIAHVLFTDIVGYSRLPMDEQGRVLHHLQEVVRNTREFRRAQAADQLIRLPTGDGMALVFFGDPEAPAKCAVEIARALREQPGLRLRMGVHTGPVYRVADINASRNVAGGGINTAQRVMDSGDAGHILVSGAAADVLGQLSDWQDKLHDLGEVEVKHGVRVRLFNLYADGAGNPEMPQKQRATRGAGVSQGGKGARPAWLIAALPALVVGAVVVGGALYWLTVSGDSNPATTATAPSSEGASVNSAAVNAPAELGNLFEDAVGPEDAANSSPAGRDLTDRLSGKWAGTYGPMNQPATLLIENAKGGKIRGVLEQGGVRVAFAGSVNAATRAVTFKETRVLSGGGWSLGECAGEMAPDGRTMSGTGQDPFGSQLGMSYQWSFTKQ